VVCSTCAVKGHNGHSLIDTSAALATEAAAVETAVAATTTALTSTKTGIVAVREMKRVVQTNTNATVEEVIAHCKALQRVLIAQMRKLEGAAKAEAKRKLGELQAQLNDLERAEGSMEIGLEVAARFKEHGTPLEQLQAKQMLVDGLTAAAAHGVEVTPVVGPKVAFVVQHELAGMSEMLARYGAIDGVDTKASVSGAVQYSSFYKRISIRYDVTCRPEGGAQYLILVSFSPEIGHILFLNNNFSVSCMQLHPIKASSHRIPCSMPVILHQPACVGVA
jgi:hypothetical protein